MNKNLESPLDLSFYFLEHGDGELKFSAMVCPLRGEGGGTPRFCSEMSANFSGKSRPWRYPFNGKFPNEQLENL